MKKIFGLTAIVFAMVAFSACKDKKEDELSGFNNVEVEFENRAGNKPLVFGVEYTNALGEKLTFSTFNYFVSNFALIREDGTEFVVPKDSCYFLCKHEDLKSRRVVLKNVPAGNYKAIRFIIGVDSLKSVSPASERVGVLDPATGASGMYWNWNAGYIFVKVEGTSPQAPLDPGANANIFQYHIGLFGGYSSPTLNNIKTVTLELHHGEVAKVRRSGGPHFHIYVDILELFTKPMNISVATNPKVHAGPFSKNVADNYADMFILDHVHNP
jgi:hypothetical protein